MVGPVGFAGGLELRVRRLLEGPCSADVADPGPPRRRAPLELPTSSYLPGATTATNTLLLSSLVRYQWIDVEMVVVRR